MLLSLSQTEQRERTFNAWMTELSSRQVVHLRDQANFDESAGVGTTRQPIESLAGPRAEARDDGTAVEI